MKVEKSCGAIVSRKFHGNAEILLIRHANGGHWSFPKGHMEPGETELETAAREVLEETGLDVILDHTFREVVTYYPKRDIRKDVIYFLAKAKSSQFQPQPEEIAEIKWAQLETAVQALTYENDKQLLKKARPLIKMLF